MSFCTCDHYDNPHAPRPDCADAARERSDRVRMERACCARQHERRRDWSRLWADAARNLRKTGDRAGAARCLHVAAIYRGCPDAAERCAMLHRANVNNNATRRMHALRTQTGFFLNRPIGRPMVALFAHADTPTAR